MVNSAPLHFDHSLCRRNSVLWEENAGLPLLSVLRVPHYKKALVQ